MNIWKYENMKRNHKDIEWKQLFFEIPFFFTHPVYTCLGKFSIVSWTLSTSWGLFCDCETSNLRRFVSISTPLPPGCGRWPGHGTTTHCGRHRPHQQPRQQRQQRQGHWAVCKQCCILLPRHYTSPAHPDNSASAASVGRTLAIG